MSWIINSCQAHTKRVSHIKANVPLYLRSPPKQKNCQKKNCSISATRLFFGILGFAPFRLGCIQFAAFFDRCGVRAVCHIPGSLVRSVRCKTAALPGHACCEWSLHQEQSCPWHPNWKPTNTNSHRIRTLKEFHPSTAATVAMVLQLRLRTDILPALCCSECMNTLRLLLASHRSYLHIQSSSATPYNASCFFRVFSTLFKHFGDVNVSPPIPSSVLFSTFFGAVFLLATQKKKRKTPPKHTLCATIWGHQPPPY